MEEKVQVHHSMTIAGEHVLSEDREAKVITNEEAKKEIRGK